MSLLATRSTLIVSGVIAAILPDLFEDLDFELSPQEDRRVAKKKSKGKYSLIYNLSLDVEDTRFFICKKLFYLTNIITFYGVNNLLNWTYN